MDFSRIASIALGAILVENFVLVKILGICPFLGVSKRTNSAMGMGIAVIFVMGVASALSWVVNEYLLIPLKLEYMQTVAFILVIASLVQLVEMFLRKVVPSLYRSLGIYLPLITTNCAVLGVSLLVTDATQAYSFLEAVVYGLTAAVGFTLALLLFASIRERLQFAEYPSNFEGFPVALVSASLLAMVFTGFSGLKVF